MHATNQPRGFIALISTIVVSFVLILAVVTLGMRGIAGRLYLLDIEHKNTSYALAESCITVGIIKIANDPDYTGTNITVPVGTETCTLVAVTPNTPSASRATISARGAKSGATTHLTVVIDEATALPVSWVETANAP
ncbi:MAG: hypothetical protein AAB955_04080 [Patescibacteria group bacterium]